MSDQKRLNDANGLRWDEDKYPFCNVCPNCGAIVERGCIKRMTGQLNFCPNCGSRMDGDSQ